MNKELNEAIRIWDFYKIAELTIGEKGEKGE